SWHRQAGRGHGWQGSGRQAIQTERLPREGGVALFLVGILTHVTRQLAPRAVARQEACTEAVRLDRRQCPRPRTEKTQGGDEQGENELAIHFEPRRYISMERRHADVLCPRWQGSHPLQMDRQPRGESDRHGLGEPAPRSGKQHEEAGSVTAAWTIGSDALRKAKDQGV